MRDGDVGNRKTPGTGMGLAIARGIVEAHDGRIWIEDGAGGAGTRFIVQLPVGDDETGPLPTTSGKFRRAHR